MAIRDTFARNLKVYREKNRYTQSELAEKLNVSTPTVSGWETGRKQMSFETMDLIASLYGISVKELFEDNATVGFPVRATTYSEFLQCICAAATFKRIVETKMKWEGNTDYLDITLVWQDIGCTGFISECDGALKLVAAYRSKVLPDATFDSALCGIVDNTSQKEYDNYKKASQSEI